MRFHQVKELVDWAAGYHRRLAEQYTALAGGGGVDERVRMALELSPHAWSGARVAAACTGGSPRGAFSALQ